MGSIFSKTGPAAAAASRKYPTAGRSRTSPQSSHTNTYEGAGHGRQQQASEVKDAAIDLDGRDPAFAASLRALGPIEHPNPTHSTSTSFPPSSESIRHNPALTRAAARSRLAEEAEAEALGAGKKGFPGRRFVDVVTLGQVLRLRDESGVPDADIEKRLGLRKGVVARLGRKGVVGRV